MSTKTNPKTSTKTTRLEAAWRRTRGTVARRLFLDRQARFWAGRLDGRWASDQRRARVVAVIDEARDVKSFLLRPGAGWGGYRAGQFTTVTVEADGVRLARCYSLSSAPADPLLRITVKRAHKGRVSRWLHEHVRPGDVLHLGAAAGEFVLPAAPPERLLFVTGGSGVTPAMSILRDLDARDAVGDVVLVCYARSRRDAIFGGELRELAGRRSRLRLVYAFDDDAGGAGVFSEAQLAAAVPDFAERATFLCGPPGLMARVERMWDAAGARARLTRERFSLPSAAAAPASVTAIAVDAAAGPDRETRMVALARSGRHCAVREGAALLDELERAGERPKHGCRMGICKSCTSTKRAGTVRNLVTGAVSSERDEEIQLCISGALSDLELGL
ncbi:MAG TPA: ferredoxin reductase [Polyangia bacterium]|nr:ferredoxin reductase [Polyangia bacterium]